MKDPSSLSLSRRRHSPLKKLKLVCSFNGRFLRRSLDGKIRYSGGETRIVSVDPTTLTYSRLLSTISGLFRPENPGFSLKYQLPGSGSDNGDSPLVVIASDDDVRCMVEEYESVVAYDQGKPSRLWLFVCSSGGENYDVDDNDNDDDDDKDYGKFVVNGANDDLGCGFRVSGRNMGFSSSGLCKGFMLRNGVNGRRVSDHNSLRKLVLKQQLLARPHDFRLKKCDHSPVDLGLVQNDVNHRIGPCCAELPCDRNLGGLVPRPASNPRPLNPIDDNLFQEKNRTMQSSMVNCGQGLGADLVMKQDLRFSEGVTSQDLNRENIWPSSQDWNLMNSHLSCGNHRVLGHYCGSSNNQFSLNGARNQRLLCPSYSRNHRVVKLDGKTSVSARCYPGLGASSTISKHGHAAMRLDNYSNLPRLISGQNEIKSVERRRLINPRLNDRESACCLEMNKANAKKHAQAHQGGVDIHPSQVMDDCLIDFSDAPAEEKLDVPCEQHHEATIKKVDSRCHDALIGEMCVVLQNGEQSPGIMSNGANVEGFSQLTSDCVDDCYPMPDGVASLVDVSSSNLSVADSHVSYGEVEELKMANLKLLDPTVGAKPQPETGASNGNALQSIKDVMVKAVQNEMQDHSHATSRINDNVDTGRSHKHSGVLNGIPSNLAAFYTHLATRELQKINDSDLEYIKELGSGNYGTVYYGKWKGSDVAIKKVKPTCFTGDAEEDDRLVADFWKEARMLGQLHHPNVVSFYGVVSDGPVTNLATVAEYMINGSLKQVLQRKDRTIDRRKRLIIAMDAAFGMEYIHEKNIVHFDLKSHNFLVNMRDPQRPVCKIGDLGLSKIKQRTLISGGVRGTIPWMAPELLNTTSNLVTEKVDVYSFGIVMWELLTGEEPYANMRSQEILAGIIKGTLRPEIPRWCDPAWRSLMERCWSSDPKSRPSFSEVAKELRAMSAALNIK